MKYIRHKLFIPSGFTLLEIMVVVFVIGIIVSFAGLSVQQHSGQLVESEARRLHHLMRLATEESILTAQELSLLVTNSGYSFARLEGPKWIPFADEPMFRAREFPESLRIRLKIYNEEADLGDSDKPVQIYILSSGEITPFEIALSAEDSDQFYNVTGTLTGQIEFQSPGEKGDELG